MKNLTRKSAVIVISVVSLLIVNSLGVSLALTSIQRINEKLTMQASLLDDKINRLYSKLDFTYVPACTKTIKYSSDIIDDSFWTQERINFSFNQSNTSS